MAYSELDLPNTLPGSVRAVIQKGVEPLLKDVHWMLATIIAEPSDTGPPKISSLSCVTLLCNMPQEARRNIL